MQALRLLPGLLHRPLMSFRIRCDSWPGPETLPARGWLPERARGRDWLPSLPQFPLSSAGKWSRPRARTLSLPS